MIIRPAAPADAELLAVAHVACWQEAYDAILPSTYLQSLTPTSRLPIWQRVLADPAVSRLIVIDGDQPVGFASTGPSRDPDTPPQTGELQSMYLRHRLWGQGRGTQLYLAARNSLLAAGFTSVVLWVLEANTRAVAFYQRQGFTRDHSAARTAEFRGITFPKARFTLPLSGPAD